MHFPSVGIKFLKILSHGAISSLQEVECEPLVVPASRQLHRATKIEKGLMIEMSYKTLQNN